MKMFSFILERLLCVLIFSSICCFHVGWSDEYKKDGTIDRDSRSEEAYRRGGMWFGPRLGKRSLGLARENDRQSFYRMLEAADALKYYYNQLPYYEPQADDPQPTVTKKIIFTPKLGRNIDEDEARGFENVNFTPRLGRKLPESVGVTVPDQYSDRNDPEQVNARTKYFSPRLGRNTNFSPRLGRDLIYDVFPPDAKIRFVRSINKNATKLT